MLKHRKSRALAGMASVAVAALALVGCTTGGGSDPDAEAVYVEAIAEDPVSMNGQLVSSPTVQRFSLAMLDTLVGINTDYEIFPKLAESWEFSDDGLQVTFHLHEDVSWHDGEPFSSEDVVFNFEEIMPLQSFGPAMLAKIDSVEAPDANTVVLTMNGAYGPLLPTLALQFILPKHIYEGTDYATNPANMAPVGTGPMMFDHFSSGEEVVLVKNPDYYRGDVQVDRAIYPIMTDPNTRMLSLVNGELDQASVDPSQLDQIESNADLVHLEGGYFPQAIQIMMNSENEYLSDPVVRKAVYSAIDREQIVEVALSGLGEVATGFFPPSLGWAVDPGVDFSADYPFDIDAVNATLDEAGYPAGSDGTRFTLRMLYINTLTDTQAAAELAKSTLADVGINLELESTTSAAFIEQIYTNNDFDLANLRSTVSADPSLGIARWYVCNPDRVGARNPSSICDSVIDDAAAGALSVATQEERAEFFYEMQERSNELFFVAPYAWTNASFPTVNTSRWDGLTELDAETASGDINWLTMTFTG